MNQKHLLTFVAAAIGAVSASHSAYAQDSRSFAGLTEPISIATYPQSDRPMSFANALEQMKTSRSWSNLDRGNSADDHLSGEGATQISTPTEQDGFRRFRQALWDAVKRWDQPWRSLGLIVLAIANPFLWITYHGWKVILFSLVISMFAGLVRRVGKNR